MKLICEYDRCAPSFVMIPVLGTAVIVLRECVKIKLLSWSQVPYPNFTDQLICWTLYCIHYNHYSINFSISTVKFFGNTNLLSKSSLNPIRTASEPKSQSLFTHIVPTHPRQILARRVPRRCEILFDFDHHHIETTSHRSWRQWHDRTKSLFENRWCPEQCQRVNLPSVQNRGTAWKLCPDLQLWPILGTARLRRFL